MLTNRPIGYVLVTVVVICWSANALATTTNNTAFQNRYSSATEGANCQVCHINSGGGSPDNDYGARLRAIGTGTAISTRLMNIESEDSDGQGDSNIDEINSGTQPGWLNTDSGKPSGTMDPSDPVAMANGAYFGVAGSSVSFSSAGSIDSDPNGSIASYFWDFGDVGAGDTSTSASPSYTYSTAGTYTTTLTVTDNIGKTDSDTASVTISEPIAAKILLIDDDNRSAQPRDSQDFYTTPLDQIGLPYDIWDVAVEGSEPAAVDLIPYEFVIWFTGGNGSGVTNPAGVGPGTAGETALATYLDSGGKLFITSQDYQFSHNAVTDFMNNYLGVASIRDLITEGSARQTEATAVGLYSEIIDPGTSLVFDFGAPVNSIINYTDVVEPDNTAAVVMVGNEGNMGILKRTSVYTTMFFGFPLESLYDSSDPNPHRIIRKILISFLGNSPLRDVLLVDDDLDESSSASTDVYTATLDVLGKSYSIWDKAEIGGGPPESTLRQYRDVIWFTGKAAVGGGTGPSMSEQSSLGAYLDKGGRLLFSSQDFPYLRNFPDIEDFLQNYFGINGFSQDRNYGTSTATGEFSKVGDIDLTLPFPNFSDCIRTDGTADPIFEIPVSVATCINTPGSQVAGVLKRSNKFLTVYLGFPFEGVDTSIDRENLLKAYFNAPLSLETCFPVVGGPGQIVIICF